MTGDIIIPKKNIGSFLVGAFATLTVLFIVGAVAAATVFNAGGGTITNLAAPVVGSDATTKTYVDAAGGGSFGQQIYTTGSGSWTIPSDIADDFVTITLVGAGASGGAYNLNDVGGGGGGGGEIIYRAEYFIDDATNSVIAYSVGVGGTSVSGQNAGNDGGNTAFGFLSAAGGQTAGAIGGGAGGGETGGANETSNIPTDGNIGGSEVVYNIVTRIGGAGGGTGTSFDNGPGGDGAATVFALGGDITGGASSDAGGGGASLGKGGAQGGGTTTVTPTYGGGGAGNDFDSSLSSSQAGADGIIIIQWRTS